MARRQLGTTESAAADAATKGYVDNALVTERSAVVTLTNKYLSGTFDVNGSGPGGQQNGVYSADLGSTQGTTLNPTFTLGLMYQLNSSRSGGFAVDSNGYMWGFRSHINAGTYTWQSKAKAADNLTPGGTAKQVLVSNGPSLVPAWATLDLTYMPDAAFKKSVRVATTANITLSGTQTIDGIAVVAGDRVLVKNQTTASQNGIYDVAAGAWTRSAGANASSEIAGALVNIDSGTQGGNLWTTNFKTTDTLGTTSMNWYLVLDSNVGAQKASPALTGTPTAPTAAATVANTQIATTAFATPRTLGSQAAMETLRAVKATGLYTFNAINTTTDKPAGLSYGSALNWGNGAAGGAQMIVGWTSGDQNFIAFRSLRDNTDNWWNWKRIYHDGYKPTKADVGLGNVDDTADATLLARANHTGTQLVATISDFLAGVLGSVLTGLSTATATAVAATDSILVAIGKLQAQLNQKLLAEITYTGTRQTIAATATYTKVQWNTFTGDSGMQWSDANDQIQPNIAGTYLVTAAVSFDCPASAGGGTYSLQVWKNGAVASGGSTGALTTHGTAAVTNSATVSALVTVNGSSDTIQIAFRDTASPTKTLYNSSDLMRFQAVLVQRA